jgi:adenylate kinase
MSRFCFIGAPGVGKGTFAKIISIRCGFEHISLGDAIRREIDGDTSLGKAINKYVLNGQLIPGIIVLLYVTISHCRLSDSLACDIVQKETQDHSKYILDGFPRTQSQASYLKEKIGDVMAINIILDDDVAIQKMLGRRHCTGCHRSFNVANVMNQGFMMSAIMPNPATCPLGSDECTSKQHLESRSDDTVETIRARFNIFHHNIAPIIDFYRKENSIKDFVVKRGIDDVDDLIKTMLD